MGPSSEALPELVANKKGKVDGGGTSVNINKVQAELKKAEDKVASLQRKIDKLESAQSEHSKLKSELAALKKRNLQLQAENESLSSETTNYEPSNEKMLANIQKQVQEIARSNNFSHKYLLNPPVAISVAMVAVGVEVAVAVAIQEE